MKLYVCSFEEYAIKESLKKIIERNECLRTISYSNMMIAKIQMNRIQCNENNRVRISLLASVLKFSDFS